MPKWEKGGRIDDPMVVIGFIAAGDVVFHNHKPQNASWLQNWNIRTIMVETRRGAFSLALPAKRNPIQ